MVVDGRAEGRLMVADMGGLAPTTDLRRTRAAAHHGRAGQGAHATMPSTRNLRAPALSWT